MRRILLVALLVLFPACEKSKGNKGNKQADKPSAARAVAPASRGDVIAYAQLPAGNSIGALAAIADKVKPGASAQAAAQLPMLLAQVSGMSLAAVDLSKPVSLVLLNPKKHKQPVALLVTAKDKKGLSAAAKSAGRTVVSRDGLSLVGTDAAVAAAKDFAFAALAAPSKQIVIVGYPQPLHKIFRADIDRTFDKMQKPMYGAGAQGQSFLAIFKQYKQMIASLAQQTDKIEWRFHASGGEPSILMHLYPVAGTSMASFVAAQVAAKHDLLGKLPARAGATMLFSGEMRAGAARKALVDFMVQMTTAMYDEATAADLAKVMGPAMDAFDGRAAMTMSMNLFPGQPGKPGFTMNYLAGTSDAAAMQKAMRGMFATMAKAPQTKAMMGMKAKIDFKQNALQVDGVEVDNYRTAFDLDQMPPAQRDAMVAAGVASQDMYFATVKDFAMMTTAKDGAESIKAMLAAATGKQNGYQPSGTMARALAASKKRKESALVYMDMKGMAPPQAAAQVPFRAMLFGMGTDNGALALRMAIEP